MTNNNLALKIDNIITKIFIEYEKNKNICIRILKNYDSTLEGIGFSVSTVIQILTSGKADLKYYNEKLTRIKNSIESLEETAEADEKFIKQVEKIENNFIRLTSFAINYFKIIESKKGYLDSKDKAYLKKLERDEMSISLKKLGESFLFLKKCKIR